MISAAEVGWRGKESWTQKNSIYSADSYLFIQERRGSFLEWKAQRMYQYLFLREDKTSW